MNKKVLKRLKIITIICFIFLVSEIIYVGYSLLYKNTESLYFDGINSIVSHDNNYYTVGSNNDNDNYFEKAKVTKYNSKREKVFEKLYNKGFNSAFFSLALDGESIIAVGSYEKSDEDHEDSLRRALLVKYDGNGDIEFETDFNLLDNSKFTSINVLEDGYLITGQSIYKNTKVGSSDGGALLLKYDKDGNLLWVKTYGSNKSAIYNDLIVVDNFIYTVGIDDNSIGIVCKYDLDGNFITYNDYKYTDSLGFSGIVNYDDTIYVSGSNKTDDNWTNAMIVKYDLDCNYLDQVVYESDGITRYNKIVLDEKENLVVIGIKTSSKKTNNKTANVLDYDGIIGKYKLSLEKISVVLYGEDRDDYFTDINIFDDNYLVVGYSSYEDGSYLSKFIKYSDALKVLGVE